MYNLIWFYTACSELSVPILTVNTCVFFSGALAGNPFPIDREILASDLGFAGATSNSLDAVSDRDFVCKLTLLSYFCLRYFDTLFLRLGMKPSAFIIDVYYFDVYPVSILHFYINL